MKTRFFFTIIALIISNNLFSQTELKIGDKAPEINITDYISNVPKNKNFSNKYVLLEFWATWCAGCIEAVPHINELQEKYKSRKDLVFIAMTDEKPEKALRTLKRIPFNSIVVSDQTKKVHRDFEVEKNGSLVIPKTVLIDKNGIIKWIGLPEEMTNQMFEDFVNGKDLIYETKAEEIQVTEKTEIRDRVFDIIMTLFADKEAFYTYSILNSDETDSKVSVNTLDNGKYIDFQNNLSSILSKITNKSEAEIIIPENLKNKNYNLIYNNRNFKTEKEEIADLKNLVLKSFHLKENIVIKNTEVYVLKTKDKSKLEISKEEIKHVGGNETHLLFSNIEIKDLISQISISNKIIVIDETKLVGKYDLIIKKSTTENLNNELELYGLTLEKANKEIEFSNYQ